MEADAPHTTWQVAEDLLFDTNTRCRLIAYARSRFGIGAQDTEDLLQDTALELLHHESYVRNPDGYVFTVFKIRCIRFVAQRSASKRLFVSDETADRPGKAEAEKVERLLALQEGFRHISVRCRRLLSAYFLEGRSLKETAYDSSLSPSSVFKLVSRCLKALRTCLS